MNLIEEFKNTMIQAGLTPPNEIIDDGKIHRFPTNNKAHDKAGWYVLYPTPFFNGSFGNWRTGLVSTWPDKSSRKISSADYEQFLCAKLERDKQRIREQAIVAKRAQSIWNGLRSAPPQHPYLLRKRIGTYTARHRGNTLVLPIVNFDNVVQSLQFIHADGNKVLLAGGAKSRNFIPINFSPCPQELLICEGFATGATLAAIYPDKSVIAAIDAGNLCRVAVRARFEWPDAEITICADDDRMTPGNPGMTKGREAASAARAKFTSPTWPIDAPETLSDFNDLANWVTNCIKEGGV